MNAEVSYQPTTGIYTVYQRGTTNMLKACCKSLDEAADWCVANGWALQSPAPIGFTEPNAIDDVNKAFKWVEECFFSQSLDSSDLSRLAKAINLLGSPLSPIKEWGLRPTPIYDCVVKDGGLLCAQRTVRTLEKKLAQHFLSSLKSGSIREAAEKCSHLLESAFPDDLGYISKLNAKAKQYIATIIAQAFEGFMPREELIEANLISTAEYERLNGIIESLRHESAAFQADNAKLAAQLKDMTDQFFAVSQDNAALREALREVVAWRDSPEGPTVLFEHGSKMMDKIRIALASS